MATKSVVMQSGLVPLPVGHIRSDGHYHTLAGKQVFVAKAHVTLIEPIEVDPVDAALDSGDASNVHLTSGVQLTVPLATHEVFTRLAFAREIQTEEK